MDLCNQCGQLKNIYSKNKCQRCFKLYRQAQAPLIKCECSPDCKEIIPSISFDGKPMKYKHGHGGHGEREKVWNWKGGRKKESGYWKIRRKHHKYCDAGGYIFEHRYIMELELGRYLLPEEKVHHIDKNRLNNDISNLMLFPSHSEHMSFENTKDMSKRYCFLCGSKTSYIRSDTGKPAWFIKDNHFICQKCRDRLKYTLKRKANTWKKKVE